MTVTVILFSILSLVCIALLMYDKLEYYKLLGDLGQHPNVKKYYNPQSDDNPLSIKWDDSHHYDRYGRRYNYISQKNIDNARSVDQLF